MLEGRQQFSSDKQNQGVRPHRQTSEASHSGERVRHLRPESNEKVHDMPHRLLLRCCLSEEPLAPAQSPLQGNC